MGPGGRGADRRRRGGDPWRADAAADGAAGAGRQPDAAIFRRLVPALLHFSTYNWLLGGVALVVVAVAAVGPGARLAAGLLVGSAYLFGVIGNAWATRGRHPGWMLYAVAVALIGYGLSPDLAEIRL